MSTTPKGIYFPDGSTNADFLSVLKTMASSVDTALGDFTYDSGWIEVPTSEMLNGWETYNTGSYQVRYRRIGKAVKLNGLIRHGTPGTSMFSLPQGFRPIQTETFGCLTSLDLPSNGGHRTTRVDVKAGGEIANIGTNAGLATDAGWISLANIMFYTN